MIETLDFREDFGQSSSLIEPDVVSDRYQIRRSPCE